MTYNDIQNLLGRYWDGEATLEEERALKAYFASGAVDPRLAVEAPFFQALREEQAVQSPQISLRASVPQTYSTRQRWAAAAALIGMVAIGSWWMSRQSPDNSAIVANQPSTEQPAASQPASPAQLEPALAEKPANAEVKVNHKPRPHRKPDAPPPSIAEALDPETQKALDEVRAALALVSSKLNKGRQAATKNLNQVETLDKFFKHKKETEG